MCGRFTLLLTWREIHDLLAGFVAGMKSAVAPQIEQAPSRFNIAPTQPILVLVREGSLVKPCLMRWGLVPEWVEDPNDFPLIINARAETLAQKTSFKNALKNRRCIIPASGYYEWQRNADGTKTPTYITRNDGQPFLLAGLHSTWVGPDGEEVDTAAIITVEASLELKDVHHRTPAILEGEAVDQWLDTANINAARAHQLLKEIPVGIAQHHPVSKRVNSPQNDDEGLIEPVFEQQEKTTTQNKPVKKPKPVKPTQLDLF